MHFLFELNWMSIDHHTMFLVNVKYEISKASVVTLRCIQALSSVTNVCMCFSQEGPLHGAPADNGADPVHRGLESLPAQGVGRRDGADQTQVRVAAQTPGEGRCRPANGRGRAKDIQR